MQENVTQAKDTLSTEDPMTEPSIPSPVAPSSRASTSIDVPQELAKLSMLALAHRYQGLIDSGEAYDQAELARTLKLSRNRVSQILSLTLLCPEIQGQVLRGDLVHLSTRELLGVAREPEWDRQRKLFQINENLSCD